MSGHLYSIEIQILLDSRKRAWRRRLLIERCDERIR
jgi:hypothetical protein